MPRSQKTWVSTATPLKLVTVKQDGKSVLETENLEQHTEHPAEVLPGQPTTPAAGPLCSNVGHQYSIHLAPVKQIMESEGGKGKDQGLLISESNQSIFCLCWRILVPRNKPVKFAVKPWSQEGPHSGSLTCDLGSETLLAVGTTTQGPGTGSWGNCLSIVQTRDVHGKHD